MLRERFHFHPLALDDCATFEMRSKVDAHRSALAKRQSEIMAKLTIFSAVFLPLGFIVGFWGHNFEALPFHSHAVFATLSLALSALVPFVLVTWFWWKRWL